MYPVTLLVSRLFLIGMLACSTCLFVLTAHHHERLRMDGLPPCHHAETAQSAPVVEEAAFGVTLWQQDTGYIFTRTDHVHLVAGTTFGWRLKLREPLHAVTVREEFILPAAPSFWGISHDTRLNEDRTVAVTERRVYPEGGWLSREWSMTEGDPPGAYEMRVFLNDQLVKTFQFDAHEDH